MSMKAIVKNAVDTAFRVTGDLKSSATYYSVTTGVYDPDTDTQADVVIPFKLTVVTMRLSEKEQMAYTPTKITQKILVRSSDIARKDPKLIDYVVLDGSRWNVKRADAVPTKAAWLLVIQEP